MAADKKRKISVTVDETYMQQVDEIVQAEERKVSQIIEFALRDWLGRRERPARQANTKRAGRAE